jgi:hypothetical protein
VSRLLVKEINWEFRIVNVINTINNDGYHDVQVNPRHNNVVVNQAESELKEITDSDYKSVFLPCLPSDSLFYS